MGGNMVLICDYYNSMYPLCNIDFSKKRLYHSDESQWYWSKLYSGMRDNEHAMPYERQLPITLLS